MTQYEYDAIYDIGILNDFVSKGWELVGDPTSSTHPGDGTPATCWTVRKPKASPEIPKMNLAGANRGLS